jgi:hypothetical protein
MSLSIAGAIRPRWGRNPVRFRWGWPTRYAYAFDSRVKPVIDTFALKDDIGCELCARNRHRPRLRGAKGAHRCVKSGLLRILRLSRYFRCNSLEQNDLSQILCGSATFRLSSRRVWSASTSSESEKRCGKRSQSRTQCAHAVQYALYRYALRRVAGTRTSFRDHPHLTDAAAMSAGSGSRPEPQSND